jgi:hypothetical protein
MWWRTNAASRVSPSPGSIPSLPAASCSTLIFGKYEPFDFSRSFQEQMPNTGNFDVVLCLLWSRLGSRLGASQRLPDGSPANSGTAYEITHVLASQKVRNGLPELHVWINQTVPSFQPEPPEVHDERIAQWRALKRFVEVWTKDSEDGPFVGSFTSYRTIAEFQDLFEIKLRKIAERRLALSPGTLAPPILASRKNLATKGRTA